MWDEREHQKRVQQCIKDLAEKYGTWGDDVRPGHKVALELDANAAEKRILESPEFKNFVKREECEQRLLESLRT